MSSYKYPYIPKDYYAATMFACKMIRQNGSFNKAIKTASRYYEVDESELAKHVRKRQGAGQKGKARKYKWYKIYGYIDFMASDDCGTCNSWRYTKDDFVKKAFSEVIKATTEENAELQISEKYSPSSFIYSGGKFATIVWCKAFDSKKEAEEAYITQEQFVELIRSRTDGARLGCGR